MMEAVVRSAWCAVLAGPLLLAGSLTGNAAADTAPPQTLYVANFANSNCDDSGPGTLAEPFCHIQTAANVVLPGQTVIVGAQELNGFYAENVQITRSGTPDQPIVFKAGSPWQGTTPAITLGTQDSTYPVTNAFTLSGVHDITIDGFGISDTTSTGIEVSDSTDITINHVATRFSAPVDGIDISGASSAVTVSRSYLTGTGTGVSISPGVSGATITENVLNTGTNGVSVNGATATALTNNTAAYTGCPPTVFSVTGSSTSTTIENNLVSTQCSTSSALVTVAADSASTTHLDYDIVYAPQDPALYSWADTTYASAAALNTATGQGAHDLNTNQRLGTGWVPAEQGPAIDSADAGAPGVLATDVNGDSRADDPLVTNTGTGYGYLDRGAVERQDPMSVSVSLSTRQATAGQNVVVTLTATQGWATITSYTVDFGDGASPVTTTTTTASHPYPTAGDYTVTATATDGLGYTSAPSAGVSLTVTAPAAPDAIVTHYNALGAGSSYLGNPTGGEYAIAGGTAQNYDHGVIYDSAATGAWAVHGAILSHYQQLGGPGGFLGFPTTDENGTPDGVGRYNHFSGTGGSSIYWTPSTGAHSVQGAIHARWAALGWEAGPMGYPTTDETTTPDGVGRYNHFTKSASIYWTPGTGAWSVHGAIRDTWASLGWETSRLGYPTSDEFGVTGGRRNTFQHGYITWYSATGDTQVTYT